MKKQKELANALQLEENATVEPGRRADGPQIESMLFLNIFLSAMKSTRFRILPSLFATKAFTAFFLVVVLLATKPQSVPGQSVYTPYTFTTLAGSGIGGAGDANGTARDARFDSPIDVAVDRQGVVYVVDQENATIRKITPDGEVTVLAGKSRNRALLNGTGEEARFAQPCGMGIDGQGNIYLTEHGQQIIQKITPEGVVTTIAGKPGFVGSENGQGESARFREPMDVAADSEGNLYVADSENHTIRKVTPDGTVSTLAGLAGNPGTADGMGASARFDHPTGVAVDTGGNVYVADASNHTIRKITPDGEVTTVAGIAASSGSENGPLNTARFGAPYSLAVNGSGYIYVADNGNHAIRQIDPDGLVTTLAGLPPFPGTADGQGSAARFRYPRGIALSPSGEIYVADTFNHTVRKITQTGRVTTYAGMAELYGTNDGTGSAARFEYPGGIAPDASKTIYVADVANHTIRKISPAGVVTTFAGLAGSLGSADGFGTDARFDTPFDLAADLAGNVYVGDVGNKTIRKITPAGEVSTLAGRAGFSGSSDGTGSDARFAFPRGVAVDAVGNVYVADSQNHTIRKITSDGVVTTLAGLAGNQGSANGDGDQARFFAPQSVAVDLAGNVYVSDNENHFLRKITPSGTVSTLAGAPFALGSDDGLASAARFVRPCGLCVDSGGNVYVADGPNTIRRITPAGMVTTLAGFTSAYGHTDGSGSSARFRSPQNIAIDSSGVLYVSDTGNNTIRKGFPSQSPGILVQPQSLDLPAGGTATLTVKAGGEQPLSYQWRYNGIAIDDATQTSLGVNSTHPGAYSVVVSNYLGSVTSVVATLTTLSAPVVTVPPMDQAVVIGANVTLSATVVGSPTISYQWRLNGANILNATNTTYSLLDVQATNAGVYTLVAANAVGATVSPGARLLVTVGESLLRDTFADRVITNNVNVGTIVGHNVGATKELGEPAHAGKPGGRSVWFAWTAPGDGPVMFDTIGSGFDTLLAVYTGPSVSTLSEVAANEDQGGFFTSAVTFRATKSVVYQIAVDGFGAASGDIVLNWKFQPSADDIPRFTLQPESRSVAGGTDVRFEIAIALNNEANRPQVGYQWFRDGQPVFAATNASLTLTNAQADVVGSYQAVVTVSNNPVNRTFRSEVATLELQKLAMGQEPDPTRLSQDKFLNLFPPGPGLMTTLFSLPRLSALTVAAGALGAQILNNFGATTEQDEPIIAGTPGGASRWFVIQAADNGIMVVDTIGSDFDTLLGVYTGTSLASLTLIASDNNGAPDGLRSVVSFPAVSGTTYLVAVDGVKGMQGAIRLNWRLGAVPVVVQSPVSRVVSPQGEVTLSASASGTPAPTYQWRFNGADILGATNAQLTLANFKPEAQGDYTVVINNRVGAVTTEAAFIACEVEARLNTLSRVAQDRVQLQMQGTARQQYVLQVSTNLLAPVQNRWTPVHTNSHPSGAVTFFDPNATNTHRFYRTVLPQE